MNRDERDGIVTIVTDCMRMTEFGEFMVYSLVYEGFKVEGFKVKGRSSKEESRYD